MLLHITKNTSNFVKYGVEVEEKNIATVEIKNEPYFVSLTIQVNYMERSTTDYYTLLQLALVAAAKKAIEWEQSTIHFRNVLDELLSKSEQCIKLKTFLHDNATQVGTNKDLFVIVTNSPYIKMHEQDFLFFITPSAIQKYCSFVQTFCDIVLKKEQLEPTIELKKMSKNSHFVWYSLYFEGSYHSIMLGYDRHEKYFECIIEGKKDYHIDEDTYDEFEWYHYWSNLFEKKYKQERLQATFNPPSRYATEGLSDRGLFDWVKEAIQTILFSKLDVREVERLFARALKQELIVVNDTPISDNSKVMLLMICEHVFLFANDPKKTKKTPDVQYFLLDEFEALQTAYHQLIEHKQQEYAEEQRTNLEWKVKRQKRKLAKS